MKIAILKSIFPSKSHILNTMVLLKLGMNDI